MQLNNQTQALLKRIKLSSTNIFNKLEKERHERLTSLAIYKKKIKIQGKLRSKTNYEHSNLHFDIFRLTGQQKKMKQDKDQSLNKPIQHKQLLKFNNLKKINLYQNKQKKLVLNRQKQQQNPFQIKTKKLIKNQSKKKQHKILKKNIENEKLQNLYNYLKSVHQNAISFKASYQIIQLITQKFQEIFKFLNNKKAIQEDETNLKIQVKDAKKMISYNNTFQKPSIDMEKEEEERFSATSSNGSSTKKSINQLSKQKNKFVQRNRSRKFSLFQNSKLSNYNFQLNKNVQRNSQKCIKLAQNNQSLQRTTSKKHSMFRPVKKSEEILEELSNTSQYQSEKENIGLQSINRYDYDQFPQQQKKLLQLSNCSQKLHVEVQKKRRCSIAINFNALQSKGVSSKQNSQKNSLISKNNLSPSIGQTKNNVQNDPFRMIINQNSIKQQSQSPSSMTTKAQQFYLIQKISQLKKQIVKLEHQTFDFNKKINQKNREIENLQDRRQILFQQVQVQLQKLKQFQTYINSNQVPQIVNRLIQNKNRIKQNLNQISKKILWQSPNVYKSTTHFHMIGLQEDNLNSMRKINKYLMSTQIQQEVKQTLINLVKDLTVTANTKFSQTINSFEQKFNKEQQIKQSLMKTFQEWSTQSARKKQLLQFIFSNHAQTDSNIKKCISDYLQKNSQYQSNLLQQIEKQNHYFFILQSLL